LNQFKKKKKILKKKNALLFKKKSFPKENVFQEMFACFSRKGFQVLIQMRKNLGCARMLLGLNNWKNIYLEKDNMAHVISKFTNKKSFN
jgi:hypothetical protein